MTKDQYFEMCDMMGTDPNEADIPVELDDFPPEVQTCFSIYHLLQDSWEPMSGTYLGKNMIGIGEVFDIFDLKSEEKLYYLSLLRRLDNTRQTMISNKQKQEQSLKKTHP